MATQNKQGRRGARRSQAVLAVVALIGLGSFGLVSADTLDQAAADPTTPGSPNVGRLTGEGVRRPANVSISSDRPSQIRR